MLYVLVHPSAIQVPVPPGSPVILYLTLGPGCFMAKTDLKSAFRLIPVHPDDWNLLGIYWKGQYYVVMYLPFGLRSAPFLFNQLSDALEWILIHNYGVKHVLHILDDFFYRGTISFKMLDQLFNPPSPFYVRPCPRGCVQNPGPLASIGVHGY